MNRMIAITIRPGAVTAAARLMVFGKAWLIIPPPAATSTRKNVPNSFGEQPAPFLFRVLEVLDRLDDVLFEWTRHVSFELARRTISASGRRSALSHRDLPFSRPEEQILGHSAGYP